MIPVTGFEGQTVAVLGLGRSGLSAARALRAGGARALCWDDNPSARAAVEAEGPLRLVIRPGRGLHRVDEFRRWIGQKWRVERAWEEPRGGRLLLMRPR